MDYTNLYVRFGLGREFDPVHPVWQEYVAGLGDTNDAVEWTYRFHLARAATVVPPHLVASFGCFSYARLGDDRIRLHFENAETDGRSPLGIDRREQRLAELSALFAHVERTVRQPLHVVGASWLYNIDAYRRLFPPGYIATARTIHHRFQHMPLWGQFLDRYGGIREGLRQQFAERVERQSSVDDLDQCFPFQVLRLEASVRDFCEFYGV